jgi:hypothetical protein
LLPYTAKVADKFTIIRSMTGREGEQAMTHFLTGNRPLATLSFPSMGAVAAKEKGRRQGVPPFVAVPASGYAYGPGFLGAAYAPFATGDPSLADFQVRDIDLPTDVDWNDISDRRHLLKYMDAVFERNPLLRNADTKREFAAIDEAYEKAIGLMTSRQARNAFLIAEESPKTRERYGRTPIGQGCLLARRLIEAGSRLVMVSTGFNQWDTHQRNFVSLKDQLVPPFDMAFSALLTDLSERGLLDSTLVIATGEFGRTPKVNANAGRDHWAKVWSTVVAGAGIPGGQVYGASDPIASEVKDKPVTVEDFTATVYHRLGVDYHKEYETPIGRPVRLSTGTHVNFA